MPVFDKTNINGGLLFKEAVCSYGRERVGNKVVKGTMSGVFNLCDIFQLIIDRLYQGSFSEQDFVRYAHQRVLHVIFHFGCQLYAIKKEILEQGLPDIPLVRAKFTLYVLQELFLFQRLTVVYVSRCEHEIENLALVIDNQVKLEAEEPSHGTFPASREALKSLVSQYALVPTYTQRRGIHKADTCTSTQQDFLDENGYRTHVWERDVSNVYRHILGNNV